VLHLVDQGRACVVVLDSLDPQAPWSSLVPEPAVGSLRQPYGVRRVGDLLVVADAGNDRVVCVEVSTGASRALTPGTLVRPRDVAVSGDVVVVADTGNRRVVAGTLTDGTPWTSFGAASVSGSRGAGEFLAPVAVHVDGLGRILVADAGLERLVRIDDMTGAGWVELPLPAGTRPYALMPGPDGSVLVTDQANARVLGLAADDAVAVLVDGRPDRRLVVPVVSVMDGDTIVVADATANRVSRWSPDPVTGGWTFVEALRGDPGPLGGPEFSRLVALAGGA
jgi:hypothetical protein